MNMKKFMLLSAAACVALAFTSCKSSESAYKKAYEKAKAQENAGYNISQNTPSETQYGNNEPQVQVVTPAVVTPVTETPVVDNTDNVAVRTENISVVSGEGLKAYSVVVGAFGLRANAEGLQQRLKNRGYNAQLGFNSQKNMYRVIIATFNSKAEAAQMRDQIRGEFSDAWLLAK